MERNQGIKRTSHSGKLLTGQPSFVEAILQAMDTVKKGIMGANMAALEHGVPRTTLKDRLSRRVIHGTNMGPKPYLTQDEESQPVKFLIHCSKN